MNPAAGKKILLIQEEIFTLYSFFKKIEEELTPRELKILMKLEKHLYSYLTIDEIEHIVSDKIPDSG